jgi:hypothetical protein
MSRSPDDFRARYGPWAVVAGASQGLGAEYAAQLAARGLHLVLIARRETELAARGAELATRHGIQVRTLPLDLAREDMGEVVAAETADIEIGLLVYNAALSVIGPFYERPLAEHLTEVGVNCRAPLALGYLLGQGMRARGRGGIILMSSLSATMGSALIANYAATKAYNMVLAEGLWEELRGRGVDVMACCAGAVSTPNYTASGSQSNRGGMTPRAVVAETLAALGRTPSFIPGRGNRLAAFALRRLPRRMTIRLMGRVMRGMYGK